MTADTGRPALRSEAAAFFDAFVTAFKTFDGAHIAERYAVPYVALNADGNLRCFNEQAEIGRYFREVVDAYSAKGCRSCRYKDLEVTPLGRPCVLATVTWELLREDESVITSWRESYNLKRTAEGLRIFASTDH